MRRGGTSLTPNTLTATPPSRRSSAVELSSYLQNATGTSSATLGNNLGTKGYSSISGSRSAATSPVGGVSASSSIVVPSVPGTSKESSTSGSPRHKKISNEAWVCPNDRQLALRAKLQSGWSVKTAIMNQWKQPEPISAEEHEQIRQVVEKAEALEKAEEERLGRLVDRLERLRHSRYDSTFFPLSLGNLYKNVLGVNVLRF